MRSNLSITVVGLSVSAVLAVTYVLGVLASWPQRSALTPSWSQPRRGAEPRLPPPDSRGGYPRGVNEHGNVSGFEATPARNPG